MFDPRGVRFKIHSVNVQNNPYLGWNLAILNLGLGFLKLGIQLALNFGYRVTNTQLYKDCSGYIFLEKDSNTLTIPICLPNVDVYDEIIVMLDSMSRNGGNGVV